MPGEDEDYGLEAGGRIIHETGATRMQSLPEKLRLVLLLASMDGHSSEEIAELLQVPVGTVKSRLHSARKQLAEKFR